MVKSEALRSSMRGTNWKLYESFTVDILRLQTESIPEDGLFFDDARCGGGAGGDGSVVNKSMTEPVGALVEQGPCCLGMHFLTQSGLGMQIPVIEVVPPAPVHINHSDLASPTIEPSDVGQAWRVLSVQHDVPSSSAANDGNDNVLLGKMLDSSGTAMLDTNNDRAWRQCPVVHHSEGQALMSGMGRYPQQRRSITEGIAPSAAFHSSDGVVMKTFTGHCHHDEHNYSMLDGTSKNEHNNTDTTAVPFPSSAADRLLRAPFAPATAGLLSRVRMQMHENIFLPCILLFLSVHCGVTFYSSP